MDNGEWRMARDCIGRALSHEGHPEGWNVWDVAWVPAGWTVELEPGGRIGRHPRRWVFVGSVSKDDMLWNRSIAVATSLDQDSTPKHGKLVDRVLNHACRRADVGGRDWSETETEDAIRLARVWRGGRRRLLDAVRYADRSYSHDRVGQAVDYFVVL
ncbi:hypothetical protein CIB48_g10494, partial [Xylaria polymorpha]